MKNTVSVATDPTGVVSDPSDPCHKKSPDVSPAVEVDFSGIPDMSQAQIKFYHKASFTCSMCDEPNNDKSGRIDHMAGNGSKQKVQFWEINYLSQRKVKDLKSKGKTSATGGEDEKTCGQGWKVGDECVAQWTEDGCWYRSRITSIHEDQRVLVKFVDYGNSDYTQLDQLKSPETKIGEEGELLPEDCDPTKPTKAEMEGSSLARFPDTGTSETKKDNIQQIEKPYEKGGEGGLIEKEKAWREGDECVAQWSDDKCWYKSVIDKIESTEKVLVRFTEYGNSDYTSLSTLKSPGTKIDENGQIEQIKESCNESNKESENGNWKVGDNCVAQWNEDSLWYKSSIVRIDSPQHVLVKFIEFGNEDFTSLASLKPFDTRLSDYGELLPNIEGSQTNELLANTEVRQTNWKVGDKCVAQWTEDSCWYRSVIESIESKDTVLVKFIDYGNSDYTSLEKLKPFHTPINEQGQIQPAQVQVSHEETRNEKGKTGDDCVDGQSNQEEEKKENCEVENECVDGEINREEARKEQGKVGVQCEDRQINEKEPKEEKGKVGVECVDEQINEKKAKKESWKVGDDCVAQWREDQLWYRSSIVKIESAERVFVKFVEYGNEDFTSLESLKPADTRIDENGQLLVNATNTDYNWKEGDKCVAQWSEDQLWYKGVICKLESTGRVLVEFTEYGNKDYTSIENLKSFETPIGEDGLIVVTEAIESSDENKNLWKEGDKCVAQWKEDNLWYKGVVSKVESKDKVHIIFTDYGNADYTSLEELKPYDTEIGEDGTIVDAKEEEKKSSDMNSKMSNDVNWKVGDECVAQWEEDKCWYKSKIIETKSNNQVLVEFIEYGNSDYTVLSMLKPIGTEIINGQLSGEIFKDDKIEQNVSENEGKDEKMSLKSLPIINGSSNTKGSEDCTSMINNEKEEATNDVDNDSMTLSWKEGDLCVAQWSEDGLWYRSKIIKLHSNSKVEVLFTDYGNSDIVSLDLLKPHNTQIGEDGQLLETPGGVSAMPVLINSRDEANQTSEDKIDTLEKWKTGDLCVAQWKEDGLWYNSVIKRIKPDGRVEVEFTEYGNSDYTSIDLLKPSGTFIGEDGKQIDEGCVDDLASQGDASAEVDTREIEWKAGDKCIAQWREDSNWYNGIIESISGNTAWVKFVDYGNTDFTEIKMLKPITSTGLERETGVFKSNEIETKETCNARNIVVISKDDDASPSVVSSKEAVFQFPKSEADKSTVQVFPNGKEDNSTPVCNNEITDVEPESKSGVHCESYVEESLPHDSTKDSHESLEVNKTEIDFLDQLTKKRPKASTGTLSHLDDSQDLQSPQFQMCQVDGSTSLSLIDSLMKKPTVGDGHQSVSGPESPCGSTTSLSGDTACVFLGRVQSLAVHEQGAKYLVALTNKDTVSTIQEELMADALSMMLNPVATQVFQAVIDVTDKIDNVLEVVLRNFETLSSDKIGSKVVQKVLARVPSDQKQSIIVKLEKEDVLSSLLQSQPGTNVAQACLPYLQEPSVTFIADLLLENIVKFGNNPNGSYFIQLFMTNNNPKIIKVVKDSLMDGVANNVDYLVKDKFGTWLAQTAVKVSQSPRHVFQFSSWVRDNILDVYCDPHAMRFSSSVIEALVKISNDEENTLESVANQRESEKILRELVLLMTDTLVPVDDRPVPLIVAASMDPYGHVLAREVCLQARDVPDIKNKFIEVFSEYKSKLEGDVFGCLVLKGLKGLL